MTDMTTSPNAALLEELAETNAALEHAPAQKAIDWALERFGSSIVLACSFQDVVIVDMVHRSDPGIEVVFLDTEAHFAETLALVETTRSRYGLNLTVTKPVPGAESRPCGTEQCCQFRKVEPLRRVLSGKDAWMTALKRSDGPTRSTIPIVSFDEAFSLVKINPIATWTEDDIASYEADHDLPVHPLIAKGYPSIGCAPTTRPVAEGEDPRAGRWAGSDKTECGLHS